MNMNPTHTYIFTILILSCFILACTGDQIVVASTDCDDSVTLTYEADVQSIIRESCAYTGCHDGNGLRNYNTYSGMLIDLESGEVLNRIDDLADDPVRGMPPDNAVDFGGEPNLSDSDKQLLVCWIANDYPEN